LDSKKRLLTIGVFIAAAGLFWLFGGSESVSKAGVNADDKALVARGKVIYAEHCASCHGANLEGQPEWRTRNADGTMKAPPHDETGHTWHHPDADMFRYTKMGGKAMAPPGFNSSMPAFGETLYDNDIWAVLSYIHSRWPARVRERQSKINTPSRVR
jgi:mono/diheme cytochrome c family protein